LHKSDHLWLQKALESEAAYVALIASAHRSRLVLDYLLLEGVPAEKVQKVWAPAGLDLGAATPEEIALSIISQIVLLRRGGRAKVMAQARAADVEAAEKVIRQCGTENK
jgi:xanthine dehydrogenase accessory factor